jgi:hypothetical protein
MEKGHIAVAISDLQVVLNLLTDLKGAASACRQCGRVVFVVAKFPKERHRQLRPGRIGFPFEEDETVILCLVPLLTSSLELVTAEEGDGGPRNKRADRSAHRSLPTRFRLLGDMPRIAKFRHCH